MCHKEALKEVHKIMISLNEIENKFTRTPFASYGSIYFKDDLSGYRASSMSLQERGKRNGCITQVRYRSAYGMGTLAWRTERHEGRQGPL